LYSLVTLLKTELNLTKWQLMPSITSIQPLLIGDNFEAVRVSQFLQAKGILVPAIRPPTVPKNTARLRISLSAAHSKADVMRLMSALHEAEKEFS